jgi:mono/diheme cytochrome c family protein
LRTGLKYLAAGAAASIGLGAAAFSLAVWMGEQKAQRFVQVRVVPVPYVRDAQALRLGKYLFESRGCGGCHGMQGRGLVMIDAPDGMLVRAPNITPHPASAVAGYTEGDWVRAIRHGVDRKGRALLVMPSQEYNRLNDGDFAALVAYVRSLPAAEGETALVRLPLLARALYGAGALQDAAGRIDHRLPPSRPVPVAATVEHGAYVANMCIGCHGPKLSGGPVPGAPPHWPPAANLTAAEGGAMARYDTPEKFAAMMRGGLRPDGSAIDAAMPFPSLRNLSEVDLRAMHAYLATLPALRTGAR